MIMSEPNKYNFPFGTPTQEEESPIAPEQLNDSASLAVLKLKSDNKEKKRKDKKYYSAFKLIIGCLIMLGIIYLVDVISMAILKKDVSGLTKDIIEIIKTLLYTLSGYLFAKRENSD